MPSKACMSRPIDGAKEVAKSSKLLTYSPDRAGMPMCRAFEAGEVLAEHLTYTSLLVSLHVALQRMCFERGLVRSG